MKILAFAGSNSRNSINKKLVTWIASQFVNEEVTLLDLNDFELPLFGVDLENQIGIPPLAQDFANHIDNADLLLISLAEHNGAYSAAFKNVYDWVSRIPNRSILGGKPVFLTATSPGKRGGKSVLEIATRLFPFQGGEVLDTFSLPRFKNNFDENKGILDDSLRKEMMGKIENVKNIMQERG